MGTAPPRRMKNSSHLTGPLGLSVLLPLCALGAGLRAVPSGDLLSVGELAEGLGPQRRAEAVPAQLDRIVDAPRPVGHRRPRGHPADDHAAHNADHRVHRQQSAEHEVQRHRPQGNQAEQPGVAVDVVVDNGGVGVQVIDEVVFDEFLQIMD